MTPLQLEDFIPDQCQYAIERIREPWELFVREGGYTENFHAHLIQDEQAAIWEVLTYWIFKTSGYSINFADSGGNRGGPDFVFEIGGKKCWVEATCSTPGIEGAPDSVPGPFHYSGGELNMRQINHDKIVLRLTQSISDKMEQRLRAIERSIVDDSDFYIVAVNMKKICSADIDGPPPFGARALFGFGDWGVAFDTRTMEQVDSGSTANLEVLKHNGAPIETTGFLDSRYEGCSALMLNDCSIYNLRAPEPAHWICDNHLYYNPRAMNPLPDFRLNHTDHFRITEEEDRLRMYRDSRNLRNDPSFTEKPGKRKDLF